MHAAAHTFAGIAILPRTVHPCTSCALQQSAATRPHVRHVWYVATPCPAADHACMQPFILCCQQCVLCGNRGRVTCPPNADYYLLLVPNQNPPTYGTGAPQSFYNSTYVSCIHHSSTLTWCYQLQGSSFILQERPNHAAHMFLKVWFQQPL